MGPTGSHLITTVNCHGSFRFPPQHTLRARGVCSRIPHSRRNNSETTGSDMIATVNYHSSSAIPSQTSHKPFDSIHSYAYCLSALLLLLRTIYCFAAHHFTFWCAPKPPAVRNTTNRDSISRLSIIAFCTKARIKGQTPLTQ